MEIMGPGLNDGCMAPYVDWMQLCPINDSTAVEEPADAAKDSTPQAAKCRSRVSEQLPSRRNTDNVFATAATVADKKTKTDHKPLDDTEVTMWVMIVLMFALTIAAGVILCIKIAR